MFLEKLSRYLLPAYSQADDGLYVFEARRHERVFIIARWLWVVIIPMMIWLHEPASEAVMWGLCGGLASLNIVASLVNYRLHSRRSRLVLSLASLVIEGMFAWAIIFQFAYDFYTSAYAAYVYIIIQASIRFGLAGSAGAFLSFMLGLLGAYLYRDWEYSVRFSNSGYAFWTAIMFVVAVATGFLVNESLRIRRLHEKQVAENTLLTERQRIARDLHDTVLKTLQGLVFETRSLSTKAASESVKESARYIEHIANRTSRDIRDIVFQLRSATPAQHLDAVISRLFDDWKQRTRVAGDLVTEGSSIPVNALTAHHLKNIVNEALANIERHASASHATVTISWTSDTVTLRIEDNGHGFEPARFTSSALLQNGKLGIVNMRERTEALGGHFELESSTGGTNIKITVPVGNSESGGQG